MNQNQSRFHVGRVACTHRLLRIAFVFLVAFTGDQSLAAQADQSHRVQPEKTTSHVPDPSSSRLAQPQPEEILVDTHAKDPAAVLGFTMPTIDGKAAPLEKYAGKVVLMVNVASKCGLTPQYEALEKTYENYKAKGFVVLGFPANNFGGQEPGTDQEIKAFCTGNYDVSFPMFSKISVLGKDQHPLYSKLAKAMHEQGGDPTWNFTKYLVDRTGHVVARFDPRTTPDDPKLLEAIEKLLAQKTNAAKPDTNEVPTETTKPEGH